VFPAVHAISAHWQMTSVVDVDLPHYIAGIMLIRTIEMPTTIFLILMEFF